VGHKVEGFNTKEQKIFNRLLDGEPHDIRELKRLFKADAEARCKQTYDPGWGEHEVDAQAQSFVRNSIRRLVRDGWVEQCARGTYRMSRTGKNRVEKGVSITKSVTESQRGKGGGKKKAKTKKAKSTKAKTKKAKSTKAKTKKAKSNSKKAKSNGASKPKQSAAKLKAMRTKAKVAAAKEKFAEAPAE
jgi:hypothetical protein